MPKSSPDGVLTMLHLVPIIMCNMPHKQRERNTQREGERERWFTDESFRFTTILRINHYKESAIGSGPLWIPWSEAPKRTPVQLVRSTCTQNICPGLQEEDEVDGAGGKGAVFYQFNLLKKRLYLYLVESISSYSNLLVTAHFDL